MAGLLPNTSGIASSKQDESADKTPAAIINLIASIDTTKNETVLASRVCTNCLNPVISRAHQLANDMQEEPGYCLTPQAPTAGYPIRLQHHVTR